eukprot:TRINITY_DN8570_c0_g1_i1.p1 TRINITY_DN8570_c0_g1~~TRINITY_DN8570_c0_g1_i1.p1  ORF type:complete len:356 (-),score=52.85 TRINITY_DN8570_c0_g1_i1:25-1092(-)
MDQDIGTATGEGGTENREEAEGSSYEEEEELPEIILDSDAVKDSKNYVAPGAVEPRMMQNVSAPKRQAATPLNINIAGINKTMQFQRIPSIQSTTRGTEQKTIFDLDIDSLDEKPWRKPGADITNYFNYGFTEETWRAYCQKQIQMRLEQQMQSKIKVYESNKAGAELPPELDAAQRHARIGRSKSGGFSRHRLRDNDESVMIPLTDDKDGSPDRSLSPMHDFRGPPGPMPGFPPQMMGPGGPRFRPPFYPGRGREPYGRHRPDFEEGDRDREGHSSRERDSRRSRDYRDRDSNNSGSRERRHSRERDEKSRSSTRERSSSRREERSSHRSSKSSRKRSRSKDAEDDRSKGKKSK